MTDSKTDEKARGNRQINGKPRIFSQAQSAKLLALIPNNELEKLSASTRRKLIDGAFGYISDVHASDIASQRDPEFTDDPILRHALAGAIWLGQVDPNNIANMVEFFNRVPRSQNYALRTITDRTVEELFDQWKTVLGDPDGLDDTAYSPDRAIVLMIDLFEKHVAIRNGLLGMGEGLSLEQTEDWLRDDNELRIQAALLKLGKRIEAGIDDELDRSFEYFRNGLVERDPNAKSFEDIFDLDGVQFQYRNIVSTIPDQIEVDGVKYALSVPQTPAELKSNGLQMDNCSGNSTYIDDVMGGNCVVLFVDPVAPDAEIPVDMQRINVEYNLVGTTWYPIQVQPFADGKTGVELPNGIDSVFRQDLKTLIEQFAPPSLTLSR